MRILVALVLLPACGSDPFTPGPDAGPDATPVSAGDARALIEAYDAAHPGQDGDVNAKSDAELAADPDAAQIAALCGSKARPIIPLLSWEYGGNDHAWINPDQSALVYCVYLPVSPSTDHWSYDAGADHVVADLYVKYATENPCADAVGAAQVDDCIGDPTNYEILVDMASRDDGAGAGLSLSEASTELRLELDDGTTVHLYDDL